MLPIWATLPYEKDRARRIARSIVRHIRPQESVLDCGCGSMLIGRELREQIGSRVYGVDLINWNRTELEMCLASGERLPFANDSLDTVCLIFVLHHIPDPRETLRECLRVCKRQLIVCEDVFQNRFELGMLRASDWMGNRATSHEMNLPFKFKTETEWVDVFHGLGRPVKERHSVRPAPWLPTRHRLFVLQKEPA